MSSRAPDVMITTPRLVLRRLSHADLPFLAELHGDVGVMRYISAPLPLNVVEQRILPKILAEYAAIDAAAARGEAREALGVGVLGISVAGGAAGAGAGADTDADTDAGGLLGLAALKPPGSTGLAAVPGVLEVGYRLVPHARRNGYATEAARALVAWAFAGGAAPGAHAPASCTAVVATTMRANAGSAAVLHRIGFRHVRTFHEDWAALGEEALPGSEVGDDVFEISRTDWPLAA